jgi:hypothetical protein
LGTDVIDTVFELMLSVVLSEELAYRATLKGSVEVKVASEIVDIREDEYRLSV